MKEVTIKRLRTVRDKLLFFVKANYLMIGYVLTATLIELTAIAVTSRRFYMTEPWLFITFLAMVSLVSLYLPGHRSRYGLFVAAVVLHMIADMFFVVVFDSTGGTVFDYAMLHLRTDAMAIVERLPLSFTYVFVSVVAAALYFTFGKYYIAKMPVMPRKRTTAIVTAALLAVTLSGNVFMAYYGNRDSNSNDLTYRLYRMENGTYSNKGVIGNFYNELVRGTFFSEIKIDSPQELERFIYAETTSETDYTGLAEGYNVVTVLCESFEWFSFICDPERYPNGFAKILAASDGETDAPRMTEQELNKILHKLYPNLYRMYENNSTIVLDNAHALEKTDISENKSILGNYPLYEYINYSYPYNSIPYSMPNLMKNLYGVESNSFHNGTNTFYNRNVHHTNALGFNSFTSSEAMGFDTDNAGSLGERNLDSVMMENCKADMFPANRRFNTFITTITMHGQFAYRSNLEQYYAKLDAFDLFPYREGDDEATALYYYCAAAMDFDKAIGIMLDYLENTDYIDADGNIDGKLADHTLITMFGDHNAYYQGVSNYAKNIYAYDVPDYCELYRTPVMIKVGTRDLGNPVVRKFTCLTDIYPTILDLLGVKAFSNLMYGRSAFCDDVSVLYSRAYDKFVTDKLYFNTINSLIYKAADADAEYVKDVETRALALLDKISVVNQIFASDFFDGREEIFYARLKELNAPEPNTATENT